MAEVQAIGAEWICLMPYAYGPDADGRIIFDPDEKYWWGEGPVGVRAMVGMARAQGLKVMLKPHLWLDHGAFTGSFEPKVEQGWEPFEESYAEYILYYAELARELNVELFCIGTEMDLFVQRRTRYWNKLIDVVSDAYQGPLTYAANWDEVERFPLWKRMDHIGVDGYFPLTNNEDPDIAELEHAWIPHVTALAALAERMDRPVLFTEMGYCSADMCAHEPWTEDRQAESNEYAQAKAYAAFFRVFQELPWYSGCFVWKWFADDGARQEAHGVGFSPQGKMAMKELKKYFAQ